MDDMARKVLVRLQNLCAKQECCTFDLRKKALKALDGDEAAAAEIIAELVKDKYVDDLRYASAFAREKAAIAGWGPVKIKYALALKGIRGDDAVEALGEIEADRSEERLYKLLRAKWRTLSADPQGKLKLLKFALSRGYEYDAIRIPVDKVIKGEE